jgi:hypothetical protein
MIFNYLICYESKLKYDSDWLTCKNKLQNNMTMKLVIVGMFLCIMFHMTAICGRVMIGLLLSSSVSKHNMWSCYDWVVVVVCQ